MKSTLIILNMILELILLVVIIRTFVINRIISFVIRSYSTLIDRKKNLLFASNSFILQVLKKRINYLWLIY